LTYTQKNSILLQQKAVATVETFAETVLYNAVINYCTISNLCVVLIITANDILP